MVARAVAILALGTLTAQEYAGSRVCTPCHAAVAARYSKSGMARSASVVAQMPSAKVEALQRVFEVFTKDGQLWQRESGDGFTNEHQVAYAIGSGANGVSYAVKRGDHLFQAPLSWYAKTKSWELSPGYEHADYGFNRPIAAACIACHAGRPRVVPLSSGRFLDPPFDELAIGCENCHGPGAKHARSAKAADIVNPAKLPRARAEEVCMNCHQGGDARVLMPGKTEFSFRPGSMLGESVAIFQAPSGAETDLLQHHEAMRESSCFQKSSTLTCHTCHSPHGASNDFNAKCASCHQPHGKGPDCVGCHMPKRPVGFIAHAALTNHRISLKPRVAAVGALRQFNDGPSPTATTLFQAYGQALAKRPDFAGRFEESLRAAAGPIASAAKGRAALRAGKFEEAIAALREALADGYRIAAVYEDLGYALGRAGRLEESLTALREGLAVAPYSQTIHKAIALRHIQKKDYASARKALESYVQLFPEDDFVRRLLRQVSGPG